MLPILDPNRNNNRPARAHVNYVMAALLWAQMLMPRREFDRLIQAVQATAVTTGGYISYKILNSIANVLPGIYDYIQLAEQGKITKDTKSTPDTQEEADLIVKSAKDTAKNSEVTPTKDGSVSNKRSGDYITPDQPAKKLREAGISPDGRLIAPPGSTNIQREIAMADQEMGTGSTSNDSSDPRLQSNEVTKISRFPYAYEGIPKQYTTILPLRYKFPIADISSTNNIYYVRMESIYDCIKADTNSYAADPVVAADVADAGVKEIPYWRNYWSQFWEYWTVVETRYKIRAWCPQEENNKSGVMFVGYTGLQKVPLVNQLGTPSRLTEMDYDRFKGFKKYYLTPCSEIATSGTKQFQLANMVTINGIYHKGDGTHEVGEDELVQTWVKGDSVPKEQNNLTIILTAPYASGITPTTQIYVEIDIEYVVQYKDLKAIYQFPTPGAFTNFYQTI